LTIGESISIGDKIRRLRIKYGLTQEELAARTELSKGFISQVERDLASPSIATLMDILEALGTNIRDFFNETIEEKIVFGADDIFVQEDENGFEIRWLVTTSQKNTMEPIMLTLEPGGKSMVHNAHEGEEFGHVLAGWVTLCIGPRRLKVRKGDSFYYRPTDQHWLENNGKLQAKLLWVSSPPSF
jgi:transcriptional regulator with XRE-family HTH domain